MTGNHRLSIDETSRNSLIRRASERALARLAVAFEGWDRVWKTADCPHCQGTGQAPSADGRTECGFCER